MMTRGFRPLFIAAILAIATASPALAVPFGVQPASPAGVAFDGLCTVLNAVGGLPILGGQPAVTKTVVRSDNANGSSDFKVTLTGAIPAQFTTADALDCLWIDSNGNGTLNFPSESIKGYTVSGIGISGSGSSRTATFELNLPGASGKAVCDRAYGANISMVTADLGNSSAILAGQWMAFYTGKVCTGPTNPPVVPETSMPVVLTMTGMLSGALVVFVLRRRFAFHF